MSPGPAGALLWRLDLLHARVVDLVRLRGAQDSSFADPLRGLYLPPELALQWGSRPPPGTDPASGTTGDGEHGQGLAEHWADEYRVALAPSGVAGDRMDQLVHRFGLEPLDVHILLTASAVDVDRRFEPLFGFLNDDVSRRRATVSGTLEIVGIGPHLVHARARFHASSPLRRGGLLRVEEDLDRPLPGRTLCVPERVIAHLLGDDSLDEDLIGVVGVPDGRAAAPFSGTLSTRASIERVGDWLGSTLARGLGTDRTMVHLRERRPGTGGAVAVEALRESGCPVLCFDPLSAPDAAAHLIPALLREARLRGAGVVVGRLPDRPESLLRALEDGLEPADVPVVLVDPRPFDPQWSQGTAVSLDLPAERGADEVWAEEIGDAANVLDLTAAVAPFRLGPDEIRRAVAAARVFASFEGAPLSAGHLQQAARQQSVPLLDRHARRVEPAVGWTDLVLSDEPLSRLHELVLRARQRERVLRDWRLRPGGGRGRGVIALFAGDSGTGKTLSAEVVAGELGVALYVVDLSSVVDKYIGETEKNLDRIFTETDRTDAVLLFDEADAIFGKRSEVKDSHDRYANLESAFLLQRLEAFDGIAVLTTNLRANIDEAFTRRLDLVVDFPFPDPALRARLWHESLAHAPCASDLDLEELGARYELSGGAIRSAALTAAYLAAGRGEPVTGEDARTGAEREYQKMGRLIS